MDIQSQVLTTVLSNLGKTSDEIVSQLDGLSADQVKEQLSELQLTERNQRNCFYWELQAETERYLYEQREFTDLDKAADSIMKLWNQQHQLQLTPSVTYHFLQTLQFHLPITQQLFMQVCEGDSQSFQEEASDPTFLIDLLLRFFTCTAPYKRMGIVYRLLSELVPKLFENHSIDDYANCWSQVGFTGKSRTKFRRMSQYKRAIGIDKLVFANGMKQILLDRLTDEEPSMVLESLQNISLHSHEQLFSTSPPTPTIRTSLEQALAAVQTAIALEQDAGPERWSDDAQQQLTIAEEEIDRLKVALDLEREKVAQMEETAYTNILQTIGGESSNYLLSDLFEESLGVIPDNPNISVGRLINLFSSLSLSIGLEESGGGNELRDQFYIHRDELIKNYHVDAPIESQQEVIQVKLLKYGWTLNGKVIIQPLVTEVKEEI